MQLEEDFVKADSRNLPEVNIFMVLDYIKNDERFNDPEVRNAKANHSSRQNYGDAAIGYVSLRRDGDICLIKAKVCPEHKIRNSPYTVSMIINEKEKTVNSVECENCAASLGGCKHAIAFLMWANRRSEEPSPTEIICYWKKSLLAKVGTPAQFVRACDLFQVKTSEKKTSVPEETTSNQVQQQQLFFKKIMEVAEQKQIESVISTHCYALKSRFSRCLSLHQLTINFLETKKTSAEDFLVFAQNIMTDSLCLEIEQLTRNQSDEHLWFEMRYGRITASKIYEVSHCKTEEGSLVNHIIGASKVFQTKEMIRGKSLESEVLKEIKKQKRIFFKQCGLYLIPSLPIVGASPDAIGPDFIVEVKCPNSSESLKNYILKGNINKKCKAQMYLQMYCTNTRKGLFCVADPDFEKNRKVETAWLSYDENFESVIQQATKFWINNIFPRIINSANLK